MDFDGKAAIVTGGARGIGKEIANALADSGANVALLDVAPEEEIERAADDIRSRGVEAMALRANAADLDQMAAVARQVKDTFGNIHILVNNAGITRDNLALRMSEEDWDQVINVNLKGAFAATKAVMRYMVKQREGRIVNIASIVGEIGNAGQANYSASKAGMIGFTKSMAKELGPRNVTVNAVAPGFIATAMTDELAEDVKEQMLAEIPLNRLGSVQDVSRAVRFLCSDDAAYITGHVLHVTGGMGM